MRNFQSSDTGMKIEGLWDVTLFWLENIY